MKFRNTWLTYSLLGFTEDDGLIDTLLRKTPIVKMAQKDYQVMQDSYRNYERLKENQSNLLPQYKIIYPISVYKAVEDQIFKDEEVMQWSKFSDDSQINLINGAHDLHTKTRFILQMYNLIIQ
jgi:surfactin synthase thioesterase subunit